MANSLLSDHSYNTSVIYTKKFWRPRSQKSSLFQLEEFGDRFKPLDYLEYP